MGYEEYKRKALEPIVNYIESAMASYSKEELEARIKKALPEKESKDERILNEIIEFLRCSFYVQDSDLDYKKIGNWISWLEKQKEQKPSPGIYWHAIKEGDTLPCRAYLWTTNYEKYHDCFEGRLIPNVENVTAGADMWYLPVDDVYNLPREGVDELPKEQKPLDIPSAGSGAQGTTPPLFKLDVKPTEWSDNFEENIRKLLHDKLTWHSKDGSMSSAVFIDDKTLKDIISGIWFYVGKEALKYPSKELNVTEWGEEDERMIEELIGGLMWQRDITIANTDFNDWRLPGFSVTANTLINWLKSLHPQPHWKPTAEHLSALSDVLEESKGSRLAVLKDLYNHIKEV